MREWLGEGVPTGAGSLRGLPGTCLGGQWERVHLFIPGQGGRYFYPDLHSDHLKASEPES